MPAPLVVLNRIARSFGGVRALKPLDLAIDEGEIVGLVGENGAGKSTLIKLLSGVYAPDQGTITVAGRDAQFRSPRDAIAQGIATIHQELDYFAHLSVAENMLMGERWPRRPWGAVDWPRAHAESGRRLAQFGLDLPTHRTFEDLTAALRQEVAIANALSRRARLLVLDEPTASLSEPEVQRLFTHFRRLRTEGVTILYVSHRLDEILSLTDRIAVLRDGELVATHRTSEIDGPHLVRDMVGRPLDRVYPRTRATRDGAPLLELDGASRAGMFRGVSMAVREGEIVGLAGLVGAGRSGLARAIYGLYPLTAGTMRLAGRPFAPRHPRDALRAGLVYVPEERKRQGLVLDHSLAESISIGLTDRLTRFGMVRRRAEKTCVADAMRQYDVRAASIDQPIGTLSGGNQQKALLARWLNRDPRIVVLDEPTRGVDVGAKSQIHALIDGLAARGKGVLFISSDQAELLGMSDRILVLNRGTIEIELRGSEMTEHNVILAASGLYRVGDAKQSARGPA